MRGVDAAPRQPTMQSPFPRREEVDEILPMAELERLPPTVRRLLKEMSIPLAGADRPVLIPTLLRHLAHDPLLLALLWTALRPTLESAEFAALVERVATSARALASDLPSTVARLEDDEARSIIARFLGAIPTMIVAGEVVKVALAEALRPDSRH